MSIKEKVEVLISLLEGVNPKLRQECTVDYQSVDSALIYGPFPSFLILVDLIGKPRVIVHVNADAPNMVYLFQNLGKNLDFAFDGAFAVDSSSGGDIILGEDAYKKKEDNILMIAQDIIERKFKKKNEDIVVPDNKIILAS